MYDAIPIRQVREDKGLVYSITFSIRQYESCFRHGVAVVQLNPDPNQVDATLAATRTSLLSLLEGPPTPQELREAQAPLITGIRTAMQHNEWWLGRCTSLAHHGGHGDAGLASLRGVPEFYAALGLADVRRAARLYLPAHNLQRAWTVVGISGTELPPK
jgi:predicted Zn-dependent peptidase